MTVNDDLKEMILKGESYRTFADKAGVSHTVVFNFLSGKFLPKPQSLIKISKVTGIPLEKLIELYEELV